MGDSFLELRVVYEDLPDMIDLAVAVRHRGWAADSTAYTSPTFLTSDAVGLLEWSRSPTAPFRLETGADTGIGHLLLMFTSDVCGHVQCRVQLATSATGPDPSWRFVVTVPTELGLVERFGRECVSLGQTLRGEARLIGLHE